MGRNWSFRNEKKYFPSGPTSICSSNGQSIIPRSCVITDRKGVKWDCVFPTRVLCISLGNDDPVRLSHFIEKKMMLKEAMTCSETFDLLVTHLELGSRPLFTVHFPQCGNEKGGHHTDFCTQVIGKETNE